MSDLLPAEPLLAYVEAKGGLLAFFPYYEVDANTGLGHRRDNKRRAVHPEDRKAYNTALQALGRAKERGWVLPESLDTLCLRLGVLPGEIYGDDWYRWDQAG